MMSKRNIAVYLHLVWGTWDREMWIISGIERRVHRMIVSAIQNLDCPIIAINGMPDHIHLLIKYPTTTTIAEIVKTAKGTSSRLINKLGLLDYRFRWGIGCGAFSVSRWDTKKIVKYIRNQNEHHQGGYLMEDLESFPFDGS